MTPVRFFRPARGRRAPWLAVLVATAALMVFMVPGNAAAMGARAAKPPENPPAAAVDWRDSARAPRTVLLDSGAVYFRNCAICHGTNGRGGRGPAVANSDYAMADRERLVRTVLAGVKDSIRVNGVLWKTGEMLGWAELWPDFRIAAVLTYIRAALNDTLMTDCVPEDMEAGTWASCTATPRAPEEIASDSVSVAEVAAVRALLGLPPPKP